MNRLFSCLLVMAFAVPAIADEPATEDAATPAAESIEDQVKAAPNDTDLFNKYMMQNLVPLQRLMQQDPDAASEKLAEMRAFVETLTADEDKAKAMHSRARDAFDYYEQRVALAKTTVKELKAKLRKNANDAETIKLLIAKTTQEAGSLASSDPDKAEKMLSGAKEFLASIGEKAEDDAAKTALETVDRAFSRLESSIANAKKLAELIGSDAAPLKVDAWVNGEPLTDEDLKGKVVLLDFWAVWCGPCIATFPHLRELHEEFADKGLEIIGLTNYYNYTWDADAGRPARQTGAEKATPEQEQEMLAKFAESNNLHHRIALQKDRELSEYYAVTGIPHVVVIDQEGKIQLVRVGSGDENARDIKAKIEELLGSES
jgi:thiol-disulfide isomerase/thioredoxin